MLLSKAFSAALVVTTVGVGVAIAPAAQAAIFNGGGGTLEGTGILFPLSDGTFTSDIIIGPGPSTVANNMTVTLFGLAHPDASQLSARLTHVDTGTTVVLFPNLAPSTQIDGNYSFNDGHTDNLNAFSGTFTPSGTYLPDGTLVDFNGELREGTWRLTLQNDSTLFSGSLDGWQLAFNLLQFGIEGTLDSSSFIPEYANARIEGVVFYDGDGPDLDADPAVGRYNLTNFIFTATQNGEDTPFAYFIPEEGLTTEAFLEVASYRYRISRARISNDNSVCDPTEAEIDLFFSTPVDNPNVPPITPPVIGDFVPAQSSIELFGEGCVDPETKEDGIEIDVATITNTERIPLDPIPRSTPEPGVAAGLGLLGLGWLFKKKR
ncbi:PEP-CTERM sorting domain-containing protein [Oscillatoria sp. FACHB-1407]|uniref:PEP-CTERM sorting domain-containing protein n=1 Tax=Oscillatoria sp. FACHB-1407 TaxID=2692847 RepID=UPI001681C645|nr:PEP-CTERM sorting domain-containing protein [Oscillatoria sp. FACHB-1407]MBD2461130.1 PEP-CTERM sorting domain-containing protein [Oscillatoria sp. FACHB-1407]